MRLWLEFGVVMLLGWAPNVVSHIVHWGQAPNPRNEGIWSPDLLGTHVQWLAMVGFVAFLLASTGDLGRLDFRLPSRPDGRVALGLLALAVPGLILFLNHAGHLGYYDPIGPYGIATGTLGVVAVGVHLTALYTGYSLIRLSELLGGRKRALAATAILGASAASLHPAVFGALTLLLTLFGVFYFKFGRLGLPTLAYTMILAISFAINVRLHSYG